MNFIALVNLENALRQTIEKLEKDLKDYPSKEYMEKLTDNSKTHLLKTREDTEQAVKQLREYYTQTAASKWNILKENL